MTPNGLRAWRKTKGLKQAELADRLGIKRRMIQYYEKGERDGKPTVIPISVELACYAIDCGVVGFDGTLPIHGPVERAPNQSGAAKSKSKSKSKAKSEKPKKSEDKK